MKNTLTPDNPPPINNKSYKELTYDSNEITAQAFAEADAHKMKASGSKGGNLSGAAGLAYGPHLYLGLTAIVAGSPELDVAGLERSQGVDVMKIMRIGRDFISGKSAAPSSPSSSGEPSGTTPEPSTHQSETSENEG